MEGYHVILDCITKYRYLPNIHESSKIRIFLTNFKFSNVYMTTTLDEIKEILPAETGCQHPDFRQR